MRALSVPAAFEPGSIVSGTYQIERELGRGGMGIVLLANHVRLPGKQVAVKVLDARLASDDVLARFKREAHIVSVLAHPNIVHIEDYNVTPEGTPYLVLEYLRGESLAERLTRGPIELELALSIARQIGAALATAHARNVVHRDLKPHNIFLVPTELDGRVTEVAKVLDFGISKMLDSDTVQTDDSSLLGTPQYMAPEQATGRIEEIDVRTDVFSLGAIVYEMFAGHPAFAGTSVPEVVFKVVYEEPAPLPAQVPEPIAAAIRQAMAKAPAARFSSANGFIESLTGKRVLPPISHAAPRVTAAADGLAQTIDSANVPGGTLAATDVAVTPVVPPPRSRRMMLTVSAAGAALILAVVAYLALRAPARPTLNRARLRSIATQLTSAKDVVLDGKRYPVGRTQTQLRIVKFEVDGHPYEAIEQNPAKQSRWAQLAREGHHVVQVRDLATTTYIAVVIDGEPRRPTEGEPDPP